MQIDTKEIDKKNESMLEKAAALEISDEESLLQAGKFLTGIKTFVKQIKNHFSEPKKAAKKAHTEICNLEKKCLGYSIEAEACIKKKIADYTSEQERIEREKAAKLASELKAKQEAEALKLAEEAEKTGDAATAEAMLETAAAPVVVQPKAAPKIEGVSFREKANFEIVNEMELPREYLIPDEKKIRRVVSAMGKDAKIPGVHVFIERVVSARG